MGCVQGGARDRSGDRRVGILGLCWVLATILDGSEVVVATAGRLHPSQRIDSSCDCSSLEGKYLTSKLVQFTVDNMAVVES